MNGHPIALASVEQLADHRPFTLTLTIKHLAHIAVTALALVIFGFGLLSAWNIYRTGERAQSIAYYIETGTQWPDDNERLYHNLELAIKHLDMLGIGRFAEFYYMSKDGRYVYYVLVDASSTASGYASFNRSSPEYQTAYQQARAKLSDLELLSTSEYFWKYSWFWGDMLFLALIVLLFGNFIVFIFPHAFRDAEEEDR